MKIRFLGGANEVGGLGMVLETNGTKMLFDYGITPSDPPKYPLAAPPVDIAMLTHGHADHSGMMPWLCRRYHNLRVLSTSMTRDISLLLANDSIKICNSEGYVSPYDIEDVKQAGGHYDAIKYHDSEDLGDTEVSFHSAGHIPGSTMFEVNGERTLLFTGDINTVHTRLIDGAKPVKCDVLAIESTYAGREHENRSKTELAFLEKIDEVVNRGGLAIVPAFAVGRTQELLLLLSETGYDVWLDGMGRVVTYMMIDEPSYICSPKKLRKALASVNFARNESSRKQALKGEVIITTSGMLDGGPVLRYLQYISNDPKSAVLLTGYQVEGTNGRLLRDSGVIDIQGFKQKVNCEVKFFDFSSHAGHSELIKFIGACSPEEVILYHGDNREVIAEKLRGEYKVHVPFVDETLEI
ncbi:MAG: MBL fold metallo-hydrolase [Thermoplasmata archaeon]